MKRICEVLPRFVNWIWDCVQEAEWHGESCRPGKILCLLC